jgi:hypothetical protein
MASKKQKNTYKADAMDCSAYGEYIIEAPIAMAWWPNTIGKNDSISLTDIFYFILMFGDGELVWVAPIYLFLMKFSPEFLKYRCDSF